MRWKKSDRKVYHDPFTGDELTFSEWVSWQLQQNFIRRWGFLIGFTCITVACAAIGNLVVMAWWNVLASYLAIFIESIVGRAMIGQTRRDARILREIKAIEVEDHEHHEAEDKIESDLHRMVTALYQAHFPEGQ